MATHSSIVAGRIPMDRGGWRVHGVAGSDRTEQLSTHLLNMHYDPHTVLGTGEGAVSQEDEIFYIYVVTFNCARSTIQ